MKINTVRLRGIRCFEDTGDIELSRNISIFVGQNNAGKSTILRGITDFQLGPFMGTADARPNFPFSGTDFVLNEITPADSLNYRIDMSKVDEVRIVMYLVKQQQPNFEAHTRVISSAETQVWNIQWPNNFIIPLAAKRKAAVFDQSVNESAQANLNGTFSNLYARIDLVASPGRKAHDMYAKAVKDIVGVFITTKAASNGKVAGYYFNDDKFVTLDCMGDGVSEMVALIVELSLARGKTFVLEEPETNLHPKGLKALLALIRESSAHNQFTIATQSNIVVRELASPATRIFRVYKDGDQPRVPQRSSR